MAHEQSEVRSVGENDAVAQPGGAVSNAVELDELLNENKRLRDIVIFLSEIIIRNAIGRT